MLSISGRAVQTSEEKTNSSRSDRVNYNITTLQNPISENYDQFPGAPILRVEPTIFLFYNATTKD